MIDFPSKGACPKCGSENTFMKHEDAGDFIKFKCGRCEYRADMKTKEQTDLERKERELQEKQEKEDNENQNKKTKSR